MADVTLREVLEGYRRFNAWELEEQKSALQELSVEESVRQYFELCDLARALAPDIEYQGVTFPVCTAEDLIIHKAISEREKDWNDIEGVLARQGNKLDQAYILHWLEQFAQALERPELVQRYKDLRKKLAE